MTLVDALAAWRITRLVTEDEVTRPLRDPVVARGGRAGYLVQCPHCVGVWASLGVFVVSRCRWWRPVSEVLACAAVVSIISERV